MAQALPTAEELPKPGPVRRISVIVPMLNEADYVDEFIADVAAQDFEGEVEVVVADGGSTDGSVERLREAARRHDLTLTVLENPSRWVSHGLNVCIRHATGDLLVRFDCHSHYPADYLRRCALAAEETGADAVGGIVVPRGRTPFERAVACAMESPFGGIGWMRDTATPTRRDSDVVTYGAFRPEAFERAGLFDESLVRNQDDEFTLRLRRSGGRVLLDSTIQVHYTPRGSYAAVSRQYFQYGLWKVPVMLKYRRISSARSVAPLLFVGSLSLLVPSALLHVRFRQLLALELAVYATGALVFAAASVRRRKEPLRLVPVVASVFPTFHSAYGVGMVAGWLRALRGRRARSGA
jgi:succinoglycan biosynthesis protein ExoA